MFEAADDGISSSAMSPRHTQPSSVIASVKLPDFWLSDPAPWFQHVEALFHLRGVTEDDSKYYLVVAALDQQSTRRVMQLLRDPPPRGKYAAIKELLLRRFGLSTAERADKLLSLPGLGDGSAVDLMDSMLSLLGSDEGGFLFPHIFLRQLPHPVRAALANSPSLAAGDFRCLAEEADRVLLTARRTSVLSVLADPQLLVSEDPGQVMVAGVSSHAGKRQGQHSVAAVGAGEQEELLFVKDSLSGRRFLVDSGSQKSLLLRVARTCHPWARAPN
ncbi:unnamed protein product [Tetraodon nigroviridis]|uniref:(spotted green pufferfish) hypothetical protein n=1 Tax=Tetraodon nigroviridis TaxID=99883 RepID=Q4TE45_TETNG|nr:unnamed protein product [Tetraodon nigroviridis]